jgi:hypothetical protein
LLAFIIWTSLLRLKIYMCFSHWISKTRGFGLYTQKNN